MSATPSAGALRAACNLYGRTDSLYMSERQCALVIHDAIQADTAALVALLAEARDDLAQYNTDCDSRAIVEKINEALAKHGEGAESWNP